MSDTIIEIGSVRVLTIAADGPALSVTSWTEKVGDALGERADWIAVPIQRLDAEFFRLRTQQAGEMLQKAINYHLRVAIMGDIDPHVAGSEPLADFVRESNRGTQVWFVGDLDALRARLLAR